MGEIPQHREEASKEGGRTLMPIHPIIEHQVIRVSFAIWPFSDYIVIGHNSTPGTVVDIEAGW